MTHERGFHMKERNWRKAFSFLSTSLLGPKMPIRRSASAEVRPFSSHLQQMKEEASRGGRREMKKERKRESNCQDFRRQREYVISGRATESE